MKRSNLWYAFVYMRLIAYVYPLLLLMLQCKLEYNDLSCLRIMIRIPFFICFHIKRYTYPHTSPYDPTEPNNQLKRIS
jgi:hypothetical protein